MNAIRLTLASLLLSSPAFAATKPISIQSYSYPSRATAHLHNLQSELAVAAVKACGGTEKVEGLSNLVINVDGVESGASIIKIEKFDGVIGLSFFYPNMTAYALAHCR